MPDSMDSNAKQATSSASICEQVTNHKMHTVQAMTGTGSPHTTSIETPPSPPVTVPLSTTMVCGIPFSDVPLACNIRQLSKLKRFLSTLQQFGNEISPEVGERVHAFILGLVNSSLTIEEFHQKVQDVTGYPLRPFVIPFLKSHLPMLHSEILHFARLAKQTPQQYLRQYEQAVLDSAAHPSGEPFEIFQLDSKENRKRRTPSDSDLRRPVESNGYSDTSSEGPYPTKRHLTLPNLNIGSRLSPAVTANHVHSNISFRFDDSSVFRMRERDRYERYERTFQREVSEERDMEDEWRNIHTMLNCILGMVDKTKRALAILQQRSHVEWNDFSPWTRRHLEVGEFDMKKSNNDILTRCKSAEERVSEVRRRAEAVKEMKRQAVTELQKAVSAAESKANELLAVERTKMERLISEARRQGSEEALASINQQEDSTENCWNCGRKANETCSGCKVARYCGSFCQHRDWESHHKICGNNISGSTPITTISSETSKVAKASTPTNDQNSPSPKTMNRTEKQANI
ncbi:protein CBFA2T1-like isoform X2 [Limulus polyphemus]|uniref:Protein CBFA2T1-like isoform X2 n=1 Tax=Limulus polyphemus TaxID=6850 RepID=A0ABM1BFC7_LIMPO|nr:protein CBFA2T1-like isoform X2 [Limulus polyphemus]